MKQLTLIRHAKSSWKLASLEDSWRPLNRRGYGQLQEMAAHVPKQGLWLVSPAVRTYTTAHVLRRLAGLPMVGIQLDERLYETSGSHLLSLLQELEDGDEQVTLVGHNPGLDELVALLLPMPLQSLGTGAMLTLSLSIGHWAECRAGCGSVVGCVFPSAEAEE
jgi:Phosphohistidine phosphatase SixA